MSGCLPIWTKDNSGIHPLWTSFDVTPAFIDVICPIIFDTMAIRIVFVTKKYIEFYDEKDRNPIFSTKRCT